MPTARGAGVPDGYVSGLGLLAGIDAEQGKQESGEEWARLATTSHASDSMRNPWVASPGHLGLALVCAGPGRLDEAEREAVLGERLRRSPQPTVGHAPRCSSSLPCELYRKLGAAS